MEKKRSTIFYLLQLPGYQGPRNYLVEINLIKEKQVSDNHLWETTKINFLYQFAQKNYSEKGLQYYDMIEFIDQDSYISPLF
jgi:hypothetical protein